jgi:hypothetical protein
MGCPRRRGGRPCACGRRDRTRRAPSRVCTEGWSVPAAGLIGSVVLDGEAGFGTFRCRERGAPPVASGTTGGAAPSSIWDRRQSCARGAHRQIICFVCDSKGSAVLSHRTRLTGRLLINRRYRHHPPKRERKPEERVAGARRAVLYWSRSRCEDRRCPPIAGDMPSRTLGAMHARSWTATYRPGIGTPALGPVYS